MSAVETSDEATEPAVPLNDALMKAPAVITKWHEADVRPSPLVEKLVASVSIDATEPGRSTKPLNNQALPTQQLRDEDYTVKVP